MLYIFVDIKFEISHLVDTIRKNFEAGKSLAFVSTVQFVSALQALRVELAKDYSIIVPQAKPLSPGEILGCTAPKLTSPVDAFIYVGDGRFHLEAMMIANPNVHAFKYDPYAKELTREYYDYDKMLTIRKNFIDKAAKGETFGFILGSLGRQGNPKILEVLKIRLKELGKNYIELVMSEIFPQKLKLFGDSVDCWVQIACPRLSIDWGLAFDAPLLTPYELMAALKETEWTTEYPMDYYANDSRGPWTNNHEANRPGRTQKRAHVKIEV